MRHVLKLEQVISVRGNSVVRHNAPECVYAVCAHYGFGCGYPVARVSTAAENFSDGGLHFLYSVSVNEKVVEVSM